MAAANITSYLYELLHEQPEEGMVPLLPRNYRMNAKRKNRCAWLKVGKQECCGKLYKDAYCAKHTKMIKSGNRQPLPCVVCCIGVKNFEFICKKCRREKGKRQLGQILAQWFENNEDWGDVELSSDADD